MTNPSGFLRVVLLIAAIVGLCLGGAGATRAVGSVSPAAGLHSAHGPSRVHWRSCGVRLQCVRVGVPLNWRHKRGQMISLAVIRYVVSRSAGRIGSLFVNGGGASGSVQLVRTEGARLSAMGQGRFDVVGWALRGAAGARPMARCFADAQSSARFWDGLPIPTTQAQSLTYLPKTLTYAARCRALSGRLLAHVSTTDDARDLDYLRRFVGDRQLTYWAVSYGSFLGVTYANMFPRRVRAMALDGLVDPRIVIRGAEARFSNTVVAMDRGLRVFESLCRRAGSARCALAGQGAVALRVSRLMARLRHAPIPAPTARPPGALRYGELLLYLFASLTSPAAWPQLGQALDQAANGDGSTIATQARAALAATRSADGDSSTAITCIDSPARRGPNAWRRVIARLTRVSYVGGPFVGWSSWAPCASWHARDTDRYRGPWNKTTRNPILVIGTTFDPATPYFNAVHVAKLLGRAVLLTHEGYGHTSEADPSRCIAHATTIYLVDLITPPRGTVCQSDRQPFDPQFGETP